MKNTSSRKRLVLAKETLRSLQEAEPGQARGGFIAKTLTAQVSCEIKCRSDIFHNCGILTIIFE